MNESTNGKSMDDVLASIRRIVRTERQPADQENAPAADPAAEPTEADVPLELTPDMRTDAEEPAPKVMAMDEPMTEEPVAEEAMSVSFPDADTIQSMIHDTVMGYLKGPEGDALVRSIIRDELVNGEIGGNISDNVVRLIQSEVAGALKG